MIKDNDIAIPMQGGGDVVAEGVSFDGATDYLSRSSDLVGNVDSKTFTFSAWVYVPEDYAQGGSDYFLSIGYNNHYIRRTTYNKVNYKFSDSANSAVLSGASDIGISLSTFTNILISYDANSSNFSLYLNDTAVSYSNTSQLNGVIDFTKDMLHIMRDDNSQYSKGRLSHLFLDYTYRDLSIEANRRLFLVPS